MQKIEELNEIEQAGFYSEVLRSSYQFDMAEVRPIVGALLSAALLEECRPCCTSGSTITWDQCLS